MIRHHIFPFIKFLPKSLEGVISIVAFLMIITPNFHTKCLSYQADLGWRILCAFILWINLTRAIQYYTDVTNEQILQFSLRER